MYTGHPKTFHVKNSIPQDLPIHSHYHAGRAISTLGAVEAVKGRLQGVVPAEPISEVLDRLNAPAGAGVDERLALWKQGYDNNNDSDELTIITMMIIIIIMTTITVIIMMTIPIMLIIATVTPLQSLSRKIGGKIGVCTNAKKIVHIKNSEI